MVPWLDVTLRVVILVVMVVTWAAMVTAQPAKPATSMPPANAAGASSAAVRAARAMAGRMRRWVMVSPTLRGAGQGLCAGKSFCKLRIG